MADGPVSTEGLVSDAFAALAGAGGVDAQAAQQALADTAKALARALPVRDELHDPELDGPPMSSEEIKAAAVDARAFLEVVADLLGSPDDPEWMGDDFAFSGALKRRPGWKPPVEPTAAQRKRQAAAARVYEVMAEQCFDMGQPPKQEAAVQAVMEESGLARSKVMQGLKDYRARKGFLLLWTSVADGDGRDISVGQRTEKTKWLLATMAMTREWFRRNPDAHFLGVPAGSATGKELLSRESPRDGQE